MAKGNGRDIPEHLMKTASISQNMVVEEHAATTNVLDLFRPRKMLLRTLNMFFQVLFQFFLSLSISFAVVQCDDVLLWAFFCIDLPLKRGALRQLSSQVKARRILEMYQCTKNTDKNTDMYQCIINDGLLSVLIEIPGCIFSIFVIDCWGRKPVLSLCQVNTILLPRCYTMTKTEFLFISPGCLRDRLYLLQSDPGPP